MMIEKVACRKFLERKLWRRRETESVFPPFADSILKLFTPVDLFGYFQKIFIRFSGK